MRIRPVFPNGACVCDFCKREYLEYIPTESLDVVVHLENTSEKQKAHICRDCIEKINLDISKENEYIPNLTISKENFERIEKNKKVLKENYLKEIFD